MGSARMTSRGFRLLVRPSVAWMVGRVVARWVWDWRRELTLGVGVLLTLGMFSGSTGGRVVLVVAGGLVLGVGRLRAGLAGWLAGGRWRRRWAGACRACRLSVAWERTPRVRRIRTTPAGLELAVQVRAGQSLGDLDNARPALAAALGVRSLALSGDPLHAGRATVLLRMHDPLARTVDPDPLPATTDSNDGSGVPAARSLPGSGSRPATRSAGSGLVDLRAVPVGRREDGRPWLLPLAGSHVLVAGATGAGKGSVLWAIVRALAPAVRAGLVEIWACDPKGGMELAFGAPLFAKFAYTLDDIADLLDEAVERMQARAGRLRGVARTHVPAPGDPLVVILLDELAHAASYAPSAIRQRVALSVPLLLAEGRAPGFVVVAGVQDPRKETVPFRDLFPTRVALRMTEAGQADLVLGRGSWAAGAHAETIAMDAGGTGYVRTDDQPVPSLVRAAWQDDDDIRLVARIFGTGDPFPAPDRPDLADAPDMPGVPDVPALPGPVGGWVPDLTPYQAAPGSGVAWADGGGLADPPTVPLRGWWPPPPPAALPPAEPAGPPRIDEDDVDGWERWAADWRRRNGLDGLDGGGA
ncbi:FtsK/SpoIIIE domain-containing protein [Pseudofrankia sp. DC12]|uniref:FtsK/SpoIIIE domain-containing protein n=1 Tax=Pseudofrankia sp. DC12 TaxID=683315 RepID=UPI000A4BB538|nr:FtsK/SpoIIIE domain-containing protein [Pseudofrankia sp. DC12]